MDRVVVSPVEEAVRELRLLKLVVWKGSKWLRGLVPYGWAAPALRGTVRYWVWCWLWEAGAWALDAR